MNCFICSNHAELVTNEPYEDRVISVFQCSDCDIIFNMDMTDTVSPDYHDIKIDDSHIWLQSYHKSHAFKQFFGKVKKLGDLKDFALIDYGCGTAGFIKLMEQNEIHADFGSIVGVDASEKQIAYGRTVVKSDLICSATFPVDKINALPQKKILITMWDVLEHIRNPHIFLETYSQLDKEVYLFFSVPAAKPMEYKYKLNKLIGRKFSFMPWEHVTYFTPKGIGLFTKKLNYRHIETYPVVCYERQNSLFEFIRRIIFKITSLNINIAPQLGAILRIK